MPDLSTLDLGRAAWSLALSLALWLFVQTELNPERADLFELQVEARNVPAHLVVTNESEWRPVQVRLSAPRDIFAQLRPSQLRAYVDLSRAGPGTVRAPVSVPAPDPQVRVGEPNPRTIEVRLDELTTKTVPVRVRLEGSQPFGYRTGRATVSPEVVSVRGPASYVRRIELAQVEVRLDTATSDVDTRMPLNLIDAQGDRVPTTAPGLQVDPPTAHVQLPVTQQVAYKEVGVQPVLRGNVAAGHVVERVVVDPAVVTVIGEPQLLGNVVRVETEAVDLSAATDDFARPATVQLPPGLSLARAEPVTVSVQVGALALRQSLRVPISVQGVGADLFQASEVPIVEVVVSGPTDEGLSAGDVQAFVDASGLEPGAYSLPVRVRLPDRYRVEEVRPPAVRVVLEAANTPPPIVVQPPPALPTAEPTVAPTEVPASPTPVPTETAPITLPSLTPPPTPTPGRTPTIAIFTRTATPTATRTPTPTPGSR